VLVNGILVELEGIMDYAGAGLERFHCVAILCYVTPSYKNKDDLFVFVSVPFQVLYKLYVCVHVYSIELS